MSADVRARWAKLVAPVVQGRTGRCADCGEIVVARPTKRYPQGKVVPKRCPECAREHHNARIREYRHAHPEKQREQKAAWHAKRGTVYTSPTARYDDEGHRICEECPTRLVRNGKKRWPKRCPECTAEARRVANRERKRSWQKRQASSAPATSAAA